MLYSSDDDGGLSDLSSPGLRSDDARLEITCSEPTESYVGLSLLKASQEPFS